MWILILFAHVGIMGSGNSNAITTAEFTSQATCQAAGKAAANLAGGTVKQISFACVAK
jgi:hypothetical protein